MKDCRWQNDLFLWRNFPNKYDNGYLSRMNTRKFSLHNHSNNFPQHIDIFMSLSIYKLYSVIMIDDRLRDPSMTGCVGAYQYAMGLKTGSHFAESTGETGKRLNTKYQG